MAGIRVQGSARCSFRRSIAASGAAAMAPVAALAAGSPVYQFNIPPKAASEALIDFAVESNLSIGGAVVCQGHSPGLKGAYTADQGLQALLSETGCRFRRIASDTIRILPAPPKAATAPAEPSRPAPSPSAEQSYLLQEVVVSATRRAAAVDQLPYSVSALGAEDLRKAGAVDLDDVAAQLTSISTTNLGPGRDKILLRGLSDGVFTGRTQSTVGIYLDDVPITYNAPDPDLHLGDLEAVEILRGPQGTLYGSGAMSGIYRIVTNKPELDAVSGSARASSSFTLSGGTSDQLEGIVNLPLVTGRVGVRAIAYQDLSGGYIDDVNLHQANIDSSVRTGGRASLRMCLDPTWTLTSGLALQSIRSNDTQYISPNLGRLHRANEVREASSNDFNQAMIALEKTGGWGSFKSTTSFVRHKFSSRSDASNALPLFGLSTSGVGSYDEPSRVDMLVEDAVWTSPNVGRLQWLAGAFGSLTREGTDAFVRANAPVNNQPSQTLYQEHRTDSLSEAAAYGEATLSLTDRLQATAGMRAFSTGVATRSEVDDPQTGRSRIFQGEKPAHGISPKLALSYKLARDQLVYVSVEEGHRSGGFNTGGVIGTMFATAPSAPGLHRTFGTDELWNYEAGAKLSFVQGRIRLRTAVFYDPWRNIQTDQFLPQGLSYTANAGDGRDIGFEGEAIFRVTSSWLVQANALVDTPVLDHPNPGFVAGVHLPGVPDLLIGARTEYRFPLPWGLGGMVSADARYVGRSQLTFNPKIAAPMGGYVLSRISAQVVEGRWRLSAFLSNPTNEAGNTFSYGNPFNFQQVREVTPQRPRTLRIMLSAEF